MHQHLHRREEEPTWVGDITTRQIRSTAVYCLEHCAVIACTSDGTTIRCNGRFGVCNRLIIHTHNAAHYTPMFALAPSPTLPAT